MENISPHVSYAEATHTSTGLPNIPGPAELKAMKALAWHVIEPIRSEFKQPLRINSMFRSVEVNKKVGGARNSQHVKGEAVDLAIGRAEFEWIRANLEWDSMIWEFGNSLEPAWIHISYSLKHNRREILRAVKTPKGQTLYIPMA